MSNIFENQTKKIYFQKTSWSSTKLDLVRISKVYGSSLCYIWNTSILVKCSYTNHRMVSWFWPIEIKFYAYKTWSINTYFYSDQKKKENTYFYGQYVRMHYQLEIIYIAERSFKPQSVVYVPLPPQKLLNTFSCIALGLNAFGLIQRYTSIFLLIPLPEWTYG